MKHICYMAAMRAEAKPFIEAYDLKLVPDAFAPLPAILYQTEVNGCRLSLVLQGEQHGSDLIGCEAAAHTATIAIQQLHPDLIINSGTCGAFKAKGANIADVYIASGAMFHDRRVPGDDAWSTQSLGNYAVWEGSAELAQTLGLKMGKLTTGSSLDMQPCDAEIIAEHGGELKDMEGAAIAFVCSLYKVPVLFVKSVTDLCDCGAETFEEFKRNLSAASEALARENKRIITLLTQS